LIIVPQAVQQNATRVLENSETHEFLSRKIVSRVVGGRWRRRWTL